MDFIRSEKVSSESTCMSNVCTTGTLTSKKCSNFSELHLSKVTFYKIHTLLHNFVFISDGFSHCVFPIGANISSPVDNNSTSTSETDSENGPKDNLVEVCDIHAQRFVSSTGIIEVLLSQIHSIVCAWAYFQMSKVLSDGST